LLFTQCSATTISSITLYLLLFLLLALLLCLHLCLLLYLLFCLLSVLFLGFLLLGHLCFFCNSVALPSALPSAPHWLRLLLLATSATLSTFCLLFALLLCLLLYLLLCLPLCRLLGSASQLCYSAPLLALLLCLHLCLLLHLLLCLLLRSATLSAVLSAIRFCSSAFCSSNISDATCSNSPGTRSISPACSWYSLHFSVTPSIPPPSPALVTRPLALFAIHCNHLLDNSVCFFCNSVALPSALPFAPHWLRLLLLATSATLSTFCLLSGLLLCLLLCLLLFLLLYLLLCLPLCWLLSSASRLVPRLSAPRPSLTLLAPILLALAPFLLLAPGACSTSLSLLRLLPLLLWSLGRSFALLDRAAVSCYLLRRFALRFAAP
jgi:hypothetical protein